MTPDHRTCLQGQPRPWESSRAGESQHHLGTRGGRGHLGRLPGGARARTGRLALRRGESRACTPKQEAHETGFQTRVWKDSRNSISQNLGS